MQSSKISNKRKGFARSEFQRIMGLGTQHPAIRDSYPMTDEKNNVFICFHNCHNNPPFAMVEKFENGPDKSLFVAWSHGTRGNLVAIARSEKLDSFLDQLREKFDFLDATNAVTNGHSPSNVFVLSQQF